MMSMKMDDEAASGVGMSIGCTGCVLPLLLRMVACVGNYCSCNMV
jgi:hypothetical protein